VREVVFDREVVQKYENWSNGYVISVLGVRNRVEGVRQRNEICVSMIESKMVRSENP